MSDSILLEGMVFYGHHGANPHERELGQPFVVDLELELDLRPPGASDDLKDTVDYSRVYRVVREAMEGPGRNLLESLAEEVARRVLHSFPLEAVRVKVAKPHVSIEGAVLDGAAVEIYRRRRG